MSDFRLSGAPIPLEHRPHIIYRIYDADRRLLYVGMSGHAEARFGDHRGVQTWWPDVRSIDVQHVLGREAAERAEREAIDTEKPLYNDNKSKCPPRRPGFQPKPAKRCGSLVYATPANVRANLEAHLTTVEEEGVTVLVEKNGRHIAALIPLHGDEVKA